MASRVIVSPQRVRVKTVNVVGATQRSASVGRLEELTDVNAVAKANNNTLVYDAVSETYVVKELPVVNGGTF